MFPKLTCTKTTHKTLSCLITSHFVTVNSPHVFFFSFAGRPFLFNSVMHLFLFIYSASQSRTCWYFVKLPMSHCMLTPSHSPTLLVSLTHSHTHTQRVVLFEQLCSAFCMFISAIVMVLLLSFLPLLPPLLSSITKGNYRGIQLANLNGLVLVAAVTIVMEQWYFMYPSRVCLGHYGRSENLIRNLI